MSHSGGRLGCLRFHQELLRAGGQGTGRLGHLFFARCQLLHRGAGRRRGGRRLHRGAREASCSRRGIDTRGHGARQRQNLPLGRRVRRERQRSQDALHQLNVFEKFQPQHSGRVSGLRVPVPGQHGSRPAGGGAPPDERRELVGGDTMNFWINGKRDELVETLKLMDMCC